MNAPFFFFYLLHEGYLYQKSHSPRYEFVDSKYFKSKYVCILRFLGIEVENFRRIKTNDRGRFHFPVRFEAKTGNFAELRDCVNFCRPERRKT